MRGVLPVLPSLLAAPAAAARTYRAAVVEFAAEQPPKAASAADALALRYRNLARMEEYMAQAKANGTQIIAFPEYGMLGDPDWGWNRDNILPFLEQIPDPHSSGARLNPCDEAATLNATAPVTVRASCFARRHAMALVIGLGDWFPCTPGDDIGAAKKCRKDGRAQFNTAVAFAEDGTLLEKYHKKHSYEEGYYDFAPNSAPQGRFRTLFGVDFGLFICFDIFWQTGAYNVTNFVFPTEWDNTMSQLIGDKAIPEQTRWSKKHAANFLASNMGWGKSTSGSGIYSSGTPLATFYNPTKDNQEKMLIADLPIDA